MSLLFRWRNSVARARSFHPAVASATRSVVEGLEPRRLLSTVVLYENNFDAGVGGGALAMGINAAWSTNKTSTTPSGQKFAGEFGKSNVSLDLGNFAAYEQVTVSFDLYLIRSWDGTSTYGGYGPDKWGFSIDGTAVLDATFSNKFPHYEIPVNQPQSFVSQNIVGGSNDAGTGAAATGSLGYSFQNRNGMDSVYHFQYTIDEPGSDLSLLFRGAPNQDVFDESWGLDNVKIEAELPEVTIETLATAPIREGESEVAAFSVRQTGTSPIIARLKLDQFVSDPDLATIGNDFDLYVNGSLAQVDDGLFDVPLYDNEPVEITLTAHPDAEIEGLETVRLSVYDDYQANQSDPKEYVAGTPDSAEVKIGSLPVVQVTKLSDGDEAVGTSIQFDIRRMGDATREITVPYSLSGTAIDGLDYTSPAGTVVLEQGQESTIVTIAVRRDNNVEQPESVILLLGDGNGFAISPSLGSDSAAISDDPPLVSLSLVQDGSEDPDVSGSDNSPRPVIFSVTRTGGDPSEALPLTYTVTGYGSHAANASDVDGAGSVQVFSSEQIVLTVVDDDEVEFREQMQLVLGDTLVSFLVDGPAEELAEITDNDYSIEAFAVAFDSQGVKRDSDGTSYGVSQWDDWDGDGNTDVHGANVDTPEYGYPLSYRRSLPDQAQQMWASVGVWIKYKDPNVLAASIGVFGITNFQGSSNFTPVEPGATTIGTPAAQADGSQVVHVSAALQRARELPETIQRVFLHVDWTLARTVWNEGPPSSIHKSLGTSRNLLYITGAEAPGAYETVLDLGCKGAGGFRPRNPGEAIGAGEGPDREVVNGIWGRFSGRDVTRVDGTPMTYWSSGEFDHIAPGPTHRGYEFLLKFGDGRCGEWAELFRAVLAAQGILAKIQGVIVKQDNAVIGLPAQALDTPPTPPAGGLAEGRGIGMVVNTPAQNTPNPTSYFGDHALVSINGIEGFYDPSYGGTPFLGPNALQAWEDAAISGFQYLYEIQDAFGGWVRDDYGVAYIAKRIGVSQTELFLPPY